MNEQYCNNGGIVRTEKRPVVQILSLTDGRGGDGYSQDGQKMTKTGKSLHFRSLYFIKRWPCVSVFKNTDLDISYLRTKHPLNTADFEGVFRIRCSSTSGHFILRAA